MDSDYSIFIGKQVVARVNANNNGKVLDSAVIERVEPFARGFLFYLDNGDIAVMDKDITGIRMYGKVDSLHYKIEPAPNPQAEQNFLFGKPIG